MTRLAHAWAAMSREQRLAAIAALALLVTMFLPWYGLQSLNRKTDAIYSHNINAFGDVSFVEAAVFLVAAGVLALLFARAEGRDFNMPGGDGTIVAIAGRLGGAADLLPRLRPARRATATRSASSGASSSRSSPPGLAYAGWRMRAGERPAMPLRRRRPRPEEPAFDGPGRTRAARRHPRSGACPGRPAEPAEPAESPSRADRTSPPGGARAGRPARRRGPRAPRRSPARRPRYPPGRARREQLSFEDPPAERGRGWSAGLRNGPRAGAYHCPDDESARALPTPASVADVAEGLRVGRLPARRVHRAGRLPRDQARQAGARRGPGGRRQDRARQGARRATSGASSCACSATRASTRPRRCTSGTTASSCCASRPRPPAPAGRRCRTTSSARSSCSRGR